VLKRYSKITDNTKWMQPPSGEYIFRLYEK